MKKKSDLNRVILLMEDFLVVMMKMIAILKTSIAFWTLMVGAQLMEGI